MPYPVEPTSTPAETGGLQPMPSQGGRPGPDADPQPTPAQPAPETARPDTLPTERDPQPLTPPQREPGPSEAGGELPMQDPAAPQGW
jgi:hypothetical protein